MSERQKICRTSRHDENLHWTIARSKSGLKYFRQKLHIFYYHNEIGHVTYNFIWRGETEATFFSETSVDSELHSILSHKIAPFNKSIVCVYWFHCLLLYSEDGCDELLRNVRQHMAIRSTRPHSPTFVPCIVSCPYAGHSFRERAREITLEATRIFFR